ncbi:NADPH-dependent FMN reductase [Streptomyces sp. NPDC001493]
MTRIVLVPGSVRRHSVTSAALATVRAAVERRERGIETPFLDVAGLPFYDQDADEEGAPEAVMAARVLVAGADALIIATPSYNGMVSGVLKNALDWLSRPWGASALTGLPVAVLSASTGRYGAADAQPGLCAVLERAGSEVIEHPRVAIGNAEQRLGRGGLYTEPALASAIDGLVDATLGACLPDPAIGTRLSPAN